MKKNEQIKVCHISTVHNRYDPRIFYKECVSLSKEKYEVFLVVTAQELIQEDGIQIMPLPQIKNRFLRFLIKDAFAFFKSVRLKAKIYHIHDPELIPVAVFIKILTHSKIIYDIHEDYQKAILLKPWIKNKFASNVLAHLYNLVEIIFLNVFDALILAEKTLEGKYNDKKFKNKYIISILNFPITEKPPDNKDTNDLKILNQSSFKLIYTGNINELRGVWNIINSFIELAKIRNDVDLYLIGFIEETLYEKLKLVLEREHLFNRVSLLGVGKFVKSETIVDYYKFMDIALALIPPNPHYEDKILTKFYEYMEFGLPIIASDFPLWKEFIKGQEIGITVDPLKPSQIAEKINFLLEQKELRKRMGKNGKKLIKEKYNWENEAKKLIDLYRILSKS